jgi:transposase
MRQALLPMIPEGATRINQLVSVVRKDDNWIYFLGVLPVFSHPKTDQQSFRLITAQLVCQGTCKQAEVISTFGVSRNSVVRSVKKFREGGSRAFFQKRKGRSAAVMTEEVAAHAQQLLDVGKTRKEVVHTLDIKYDTLRKAIDRGQLHERPAQHEPEVVSDKSQRTRQDAVAEMGTACTRPGERVLAALGMLNGAPIRFEPCRGVSFGGVLCALPALAANGLFRHLKKCFPSLSGYYTTLHVMTLLAFMALCRIRAVEQLQYESPGEFGKLLGLDRIPEVRCLRDKMSHLSINESPQEWAGMLSQDWLRDAPELAGALYVDGHVRLYHGSKTKLPRRYVSRQRLCLRGTTDYWVNDALGQPFFLVERAVDQGLLEVLRNDIVPRLLKEVPNQPSKQELDESRYRSRFVIVFDREAYSPVFFKEMWEKHRIACITYHKYPKEDWPKEEFVETYLTLPSGEQVCLQMAERGSWIGSRQSGLWVREVRKLSRNEHQTSLVSTVYDRQDLNDAAKLFGRWSQENFFQYMMKHFAIDALSEYRTEEFPGTIEPVRNPAWNELDWQLRSINSKLRTRRAKFAAHTLDAEANEKDVAKWEKDKAELLEEVEQLEHECEEVKTKRKETPKHIPWEELPEEHKFQRLAPSQKQLVDTVKMVAYRAETAMSLMVREQFSHKDEARALLRDLFRSEADLLPDVAAGTLRVTVHSFANPRSNRAIRHLLEQLNAAESTYPGTNLRLIYALADGLET